MLRSRRRCVCSHMCRCRCVCMRMCMRRCECVALPVGLREDGGELTLRHVNGDERGKRRDVTDWVPREREGLEEREEGREEERGGVCDTGTPQVKVAELRERLP